MIVSTSSTLSPRRIQSVVERDPRWPLIVARDRRADGSFVYSVATTGVYLPAVLRVAARAPRERALPRHDG